MHPKIREFFERSNKSIISWTYNISHVHFYDDGPRTSIISDEPNVLAWGDKDKLRYKLNDKWHTEEEMLRLIRLKAFL